ncbi:MAG TPA: hypothetical protein VGH32_08710 [Pirellulales bacterium]
MNALMLFAAAMLLAPAADAKPSKPKALSEADVLKLVELAIDDSAITARLHKGGVDFKVDDVVIERLRKAGASEKVLLALQNKDAPAEKPVEGVVASTAHESGTTLEITELKRTTDGFLQVSFRYRNPTDSPILVYKGALFVVAETDNSSHMISSMYYVDPKTKKKYGTVKGDDGKQLASTVRGKDVVAAANGYSPTYWVNLAGAGSAVDKATFYFQDAPPMEDVALPAPLKK